MDIHETYKHFQHEQHDAFNPEQRTRFDAFGEVRMDPTVEGFDTWSLAGYAAQMQARKDARVRVLRQEAEHEHALALKREANEHARREANRLMRLRQGLKFK